MRNSLQRAAAAFRSSALATALGLTIWGCSREPSNVGPVTRPAIEAAFVVSNPDNVLSAVVSVRARHADSVGVIFHLSGSANTTDSAVPAVVPVLDQVRITVLGLLPASEYVLHVIAYGGMERETGDALIFTTDTLPQDLPRFSAGGSDPSPGFVVFGAGKYGLVIDNTGRVVWYHRFANGPGLNFMAQPNGRYVALPPSPDTAVINPWVEVDPQGNVTRTLGCARGLRPRFHDLISERDGGYWIMCDETRTMDLTLSGGVANARVTGTVVQHISATGAVLFQWSPFDHLQITDLDSASRTGATVNWTHGNAIDIDADGNLIVSFRSLNEITGIDTATGQVLWRMGGLRNQFAFLDTPTPAFSRQHGVRMYAAGHLLLLDNLGDLIESRAERYVFDPEVRAARLIQSYGSIPGVSTPIGGSVQDLPGGRTLVSFGARGRVEEYDIAGRMLWHVEGNAGYVFRTQRILSLYAPGVGSSR